MGCAGGSWGRAGCRPRPAAAGSGLQPAEGETPGTEPRRGSGSRPPLAFPVPVLPHGSKPARAARGGDPPSSPGLEETATRRCSQSRAAAVRAAGISVASPREAGGGEGRQGRGPGSLPAAALAPRGSRRGQPGGSLARGPCVPSRRTRKSEAAGVCGEELRSSYRRWKPYCCIKLSAPAATSFASIIYFLLQVLFNFDPTAAACASPPLPRPSDRDSVSYRKPLVLCCTPAPETGIKNRSSPSSRQSPHRRRRKAARRAQAASGGGARSRGKPPETPPHAPRSAPGTGAPGAENGTPHTGSAWG